MDITFTSSILLPEEFYPKPATKVIPDWYKETQSYLNGEKIPEWNGSSPATIKRCMPVFDALTAGYIIVSSADVYVSQREGQPYYQWPNLNMIEFHPDWQADKHPSKKEFPSIPKWINPWGVKTPKGYSTLFVQPFHRESVFTIMPGIVDTDTYNVPVNFPFTLNDPKFEGTIPAGTPIAQVIPFKRDDWEMKIGKEEELKDISTQSTTLLGRFFDRYKTNFRVNKEYK